MTIIYPPGPISRLGIKQALTNIDAHIAYKGWDGSIFHMEGPLTPVAGAQNGVILQTIQGLGGQFVHIANQGARQHGATWQDALFNQTEIDFTLETSAAYAAEHRSVVRGWLGAWRPDKLGLLSWFTPEMGEWWCDVRHGKPIPDQLKYAWGTRQTFTWTARNDDAFWKSFDSVSRFPQEGDTFTGNGTGFLPLTNIGTEDGWARYLCYGPGTFHFGDGPGSSSMISFGPLEAGQIVLITTLPRLRSIVDLTPTAPLPQQLNSWQALIKDLISFATINNVPPLLQQFESWFGILPPQGVLYSLLNGRFTTPIPGKIEGLLPVESHIPVEISGGNASSKVVAALTPLRTWPE